MVNLLSKQVDRLRSLSVPDLTRESDRVVGQILDHLLDLVLDKGEWNMVKSRHCHHCHRPLSHPEHAGIASGVNQCTLDHFDLCPGGRKTSQDWTGCPIITSDTESDEAELGKQEAAELSGRSSNLGTVTYKDIYLDKEDGILVDNGLAELDPKVPTDSLQDWDADTESDDEEERILQSEIEKLRVQVANDEAKFRSTEKRKQKMMQRQKLEQEKAELLHRAKAQQKLPSVQQSMVSNSFLGGLEQNHGRASRSTVTTAADHLHEKATALAAK